jgi:glycolate oxidase
VGVEKKAYLPEQFGEVEMELMRRLRLAIDPLGLANRGKVLSIEGTPSSESHDGSGEWR